MSLRILAAFVLVSSSYVESHSSECPPEAPAERGAAMLDFEESRAQLSLLQTTFHVAAPVASSALPFDYSDFGYPARDFEDLAFQQTLAEEAALADPKTGSSGDTASGSAESSKDQALAESSKDQAKNETAGDTPDANKTADAKEEQPETKVPEYGLPGEEGVEGFQTPKLLFAAMPDEQVQAEGKLLREQHEVDGAIEKTREAWAGLKAETYHSLNMSSWRMQDLPKLENDKRRMQTLAELNTQKAETAHKSALAAKDRARKERAVAVVSEALRGERQRRAEAEQAAFKEANWLAALRDDEREANASAQASLEEDRLGIHHWEKQVSHDAVDALASLGLRDTIKGLTKAQVDETKKTLEQASDHLATAIASAGDESPEPLVLSSVATATPKSTVLLQQSPPCANQSVDLPSLPTTELGPKHDSCTPQCTWKCATSKCDEVCKPKCQAPRCQTRCTGMSTAGCQMECEDPHCAVVCPQRACAGHDCPICQTQCSKPMCKLQCPVGTQNCENVCEQPLCEWECHAPTKCPAPKCQMECEMPKNCMGSTYRDLPKLKPGQMIVRSFETPLSLRQQAASLGGISAQGGLTVPVAIVSAAAAPAGREPEVVHRRETVPVRAAAGVA